jgi:hypothetical protein
MRAKKFVLHLGVNVACAFRVTLGTICGFL